MLAFLRLVGPPLWACAFIGAVYAWTVGKVDAWLTRRRRTAGDGTDGLAGDERD